MFKEGHIQLSNRILKQLDSSTKNLLTLDQKFSRSCIYTAIWETACTTRTAEEIETLQQQWFSTKQTPTEILDAYTARIKAALQEFNGAHITLQLADIGHRWRLGLRHGFAKFNCMCHIN
eukprot:1355355-Ditylum_brightwellii.AAC.1